MRWNVTACGTGVACVCTGPRCNQQGNPPIDSILSFYAPGRGKNDDAALVRAQLRSGLPRRVGPKSRPTRHFRPLHSSPPARPRARFYFLFGRRNLFSRVKPPQVDGVAGPSRRQTGKPEITSRTEAGPLDGFAIQKLTSSIRVLVNASFQERCLLDKMSDLGNDLGDAGD